VNRLSVLVDIAGRVTLNAEADPVVAAAAVAVETSALPGLRIELAALPKWARASQDNVEHVADLIRSQALGAVVLTVARDNPAWADFIGHAEELQAALLKTSRSVAGWAKPANILRFILLGSACGAALGHSIYRSRGPSVLTPTGLRAVECSVICDSEIQGAENIEVFRSFWEPQRIPRQRLAEFRVDMLARDITLTTAQDEPALLLPDYVAGLGLTAVTQGQSAPNNGIQTAFFSDQVRMLQATGKLLLLEEAFNHSYEQMFGDVMSRAREINDA